jgi:polyphosphate glucokinase
MEILGIDVGGTGIKGAPVDVSSGSLSAPRHRLLTPPPAKPRQMAEVVAEIARHFQWQGPIGVGFPSALRNGVVLTAANIHQKWIGVDAKELFSQATGCPVCVVNDADAAGLAEVTFGAGRGRMGVIIVVTIGTGLGTALFTDGKLLPNAELGHLKMNGKDAELSASDAARTRNKLSWSKWGKRFNDYLAYLEKLFWPDMFILGGGVSKQFDKFSPMIKIQTEVVLAQFLNEAGIVGAALSALSCRTESDQAIP